MKCMPSSQTLQPPLPVLCSSAGLRNAQRGAQRKARHQAKREAQHVAATTAATHRATHRGIHANNAAGPGPVHLKTDDAPMSSVAPWLVAQVLCRTFVHNIWQSGCATVHIKGGFEALLLSCLLSEVN
jgi:hypothetical protein